MEGLEWTAAMMDIVEELRRDRESGAKRLVCEYKAGLMSIARRFFANESDAEELVNATFAKAVDNIDGYLEKSAFFAWLCQILNNEFRNSVKRKSNRNEICPGDVPELEDEGARDEIYENLDATLLRTAIAELNPEQREVIVLRYFEDLPIEKIAKFLTLPAGTVRSRLFYARKALAARLGAGVKEAVKKPGVKAVLVALALCGLTALGAAVWNLAEGARAKPAPSASAAETAAETRTGATGATGGTGEGTGATGGTGATDASPARRASPAGPAGPSVSSVPSVNDLSTSSTQGEQNMNATTTSRAAAMFAAATVATTAAIPFSASAYVNTDDRAVIPPNEIMTVEVAADMVWDKPVFVDGILRKTGAGKLTIVGEKLYGHGKVEVAEGELAVTATGSGSVAIEAPDVLADAAIWLDATRHVAGTDGAAATVAAKTWYDVREENWATVGAARSYIYAEGRDNLATGGLLPSLGLDEAGRAFIDFGGFKSGQYMAWCTPSGASASIPVFNSFAAYNPHGQHGHLLGTVTATVYFETARDRFFVASGLNPTYRNHLRNGRLFRDGERVATTDLIDTNAVQVVETESYPVGKNADAFFNFRSYQQSAGSGTNGDRVGGGRLHEVVVFTNLVAETDRVVVGHYLLRKWVNTSGYGAIPAFSVARGAALDIDAAIAAATTVESEGEAKIGGTTVSLGKEAVADPYAGLGGTLETDAGAAVSNLVGAALVADAGKIYDSDTFNTVTATAGAAGEIRKTGDGSLRLAGLDSATSIVIDGGAAGVEPVLNAQSVELSANVIADGSFENIVTTDDYKAYGPNMDMGEFWTSTPFQLSSPSARIVNWNGSLARNNIWAGQDPLQPDGTYFAALKRGAGITQRISLKKAGRYEITMRVSQYSGRAVFARIYVDDAMVATAQSPSRQKDWDFVRFETPWFAAGSHDFKIISETVEDSTIAIDDVQMRWIDDIHATALENANFEDCDWVGGSATILPNASNVRTAIDRTICTNAVLQTVFVTNWTASGAVELVRSLPHLRSDANFDGPATGTGSISAFLPKGASLAQTVTIPEDGVYALSALATCYCKPTASASQTTGSLVLSLGSASETIALDNWSLKRVGMGSVVRLAAGDTVSVSVAAENTSGANNLLVDDVRLVRMDNLVANPGFEEGGSNVKSPAQWTVVANSNNTLLFRSDDDAPSSNTRVQTWGRSFVDGIYRLRLPSGVHVEQTIPLSSGYYRLSFWCGTRYYDESGPREPAPILVTLANGSATNLYTVVTPSRTSREMMRREFLVRIDVGGAWALGFESLSEGKNSFIDAVCLVPAEGFAGTEATDAGDAAVFSVASGATLGLDWPGVVDKAVRVRVAGRSLPGDDVTAASAPESLHGPGTIRIVPPATVIIIR